MMRRNLGKTVVEYVALFLMVAGAFLVMKYYISRAMHGHLKMGGDSFAFGRQWDRTKSAECGYAQTNSDYGIWFDRTCFQEAARDCKMADYACEDAARLLCASEVCCEHHMLQVNQGLEPAGRTNCG